MPKVVSTSEAKNQFSAMIEWAVEHEDGVVVENHGRPRAAIISFEEYEKMQELQKRARRQAALERVRRVKERVSARNQDLTEEEAMALADRFVRDVIDDMAAEGILKFDRDQR